MQVLSVNVYKQQVQNNGTIKARARVMLEADDMSVHEIDSGTVWVGATADMNSVFGARALAVMAHREEIAYLQDVREGNNPFIKIPIWNDAVILKQQAKNAALEAENETSREIAVLQAKALRIAETKTELSS